MKPSIDVRAMTAQLLPRLGDDEDVEIFLDSNASHACGSREHRLAEWLLERGFSHRIEPVLTPCLGNTEAKQLLAAAGVAEIPATVPERILKWLEIHHVPTVMPVPGAQMCQSELEVLRTGVAAIYEDHRATARECALVRQNMELIAKEVVAYQWGLLLLAQPESKTLLERHVDKYRNEYYPKEFDTSSREGFLNSVANVRLEARSLMVLLDKCVSFMGKGEVLRKAVAQLIPGDWALTRGHVDAMKAFFSVINPQLHATPGPMRPPREEFFECWDAFDAVHAEWRARGVFPRIIQRKEVVENDWGTVVRVFDLTEWRGPRIDPDLPELQLYCGESSPPSELLAQPSRPLYAYLANNPISLRFEVQPRPETLSDEVGKAVADFYGVRPARPLASARP